MTIANRLEGLTQHAAPLRQNVGRFAMIGGAGGGKPASSGQGVRYSPTSAIDFFAVSEAEDQYEQAIVFDLADKPVVADAVLPEFPEAGAVERFTNAAGIFQLGKPLG